MEHGSPFFDHIHDTKSSSDQLPRGNSSTNTRAQGNPSNVGVTTEEQTRNKVVQDEDLRIPINNLIRIMHRALPPQVIVSEDAKETVQTCVSEFIGFIMSEANDRCKEECRKIVTAEDIIWAMNRLGFEDYVGPLTVYLQNYRKNEVESLVPREGHVPRRQNMVGYGMPPPPTFQPQFPSYGSDFATMVVARGLNKDGSGASGSRSGND